MNKGGSIAVLVVGVLLLIFGIDAYHSASSGVSRAVTGTPTDKAIFFLIGGAVLAIWGFVGLSSRRNP